jgi:hypothetical protein
MEYLVKKAWNGSGRFDAYLKVGEEVGHLHKLAVEWQKKYVSWGQNAHEI